MMYSKLWKSFLGGLVIVLISGYVSLGWSACQRPLSISFWKNYTPFQYVDSEGAALGFDAEVIALALEKEGCQMQTYIETPWKRQLANLESGDQDLIADASKTKEREKFAYFSEPYRQEYVALYVRKGESEKYKIQSLKDIAGQPFKLGVYQGSYFGEEFKTLMNDPKFKAQVQEVTQNSQNKLKLVAKRIDGFLGWPPSTDKAIVNDGMSDKIERHPMPLISTGTIHLMFSKKSTSPEIVQAFNKGLAKLKASGRYQELSNKYFKQYNLEF